MTIGTSCRMNWKGSMRMKKRALCWLLVLVMVFSLMPMFGVSAAASDDPTQPDAVTQSGMVLSKKAELQPDGSYTLTMEVYAKSTMVEEQVEIPTDYILVLDNSTATDKGDMNAKLGALEPENKKWKISEFYSTKNAVYYYEDGEFYRLSLIERSEAQELKDKMLSSEKGKLNERGPNIGLFSSSDPQSNYSTICFWDKNGNFRIPANAKWAPPQNQGSADHQVYPPNAEPYLY